LPFSGLFSNPLYSTLTPDTLSVAASKTGKIRGNFVDWKSPYMWDYIVWTKSNNVKINEQTFKDFSITVFGSIAVEEYYNSYYNESTALVLDKFKDKTKVTEIDYMDLFFKGNISNTWPLKNINKMAIKQYSLENLEIIKQISTIVTDELAKFLIEKISILEFYLGEIRD